jgi:hypothetical protein
MLLGFLAHLSHAAIEDLWSGTNVLDPVKIKIRGAVHMDNLDYLEVH